MLLIYCLLLLTICVCVGGGGALCLVLTLQCSIRLELRPHQIIFLDSHPNFLKTWGGWEVSIFFLTALKNRTILKETFKTLNLNCQNE